MMGGTQSPMPSQNVLGLTSVWLSGRQVMGPVSHDVVAEPKLHSPVKGSQSDVPQGTLVLVHAVCVQQSPVPDTPQTFDMHSAFAAHGPSEICGVQTPPPARLAQYQPSEQSAAPFAGSQVPAQAVPALLQARFIGHWTGFAAEQAPLLQTLPVKRPY
jgi:hypothetical protein